MTPLSLRRPAGTVRQLAGGGVDTLCINTLLGDPPLVHIDYGQPYAAAEGYALDRLYYGDQAPYTLQGPSMGGSEQADGHVPHRNLALLATAANTFPDTDVWVLGAVRGESSPDKSARFLRAAGKVLSASEHRAVKVVAPARHLTKTQLVELYLREHNHSDWAYAQLRATRSCYADNGAPWATHCGQCMACFRRWVAFVLNGVDITNHFAADPAAWPGARPDARRALAYLRGTPWTELPGIARSNLDAWRALRACGHRAA